MKLALKESYGTKQPVNSLICLYFFRTTLFIVPKRCPPVPRKLAKTRTERKRSRKKKKKKAWTLRFLFSLFSFQYIYQEYLTFGFVFKSCCLATAPVRSALCSAPLAPQLLGYLHGPSGCVQSGVLRRGQRLCWLTGSGLGWSWWSDRGVWWAG